MKNRAVSVWGNSNQIPVGTRVSYRYMDCPSGIVLESSIGACRVKFIDGSVRSVCNVSVRGVTRHA